MNSALGAVGTYLVVVAVMMAWDLTMRRYPRFARRISWPSKSSAEFLEEAGRRWPAQEEREHMMFMALLFTNALMAIPMTGALYLLAWVLQ